MRRCVAAGSWRIIRSTTATAGTAEAALSPVDFELSYPRLPGFCCNSEGKASKLLSSWSHFSRRTHSRKSPYPRWDKNPDLRERLFRPAREFGCPASRRAC
jgi:hypothetical protein